MLNNFIIQIVFLLFYSRTTLSEKVCIGTNNLMMTVPSDPERHYFSLKERYTNCTYVNGNLEIVYLRNLEQDYSFLEDIREVTGYVLISNVQLDYLSLSSLQIIRGQNLFKTVSYGDFALFAALTTLKEIGLFSLKEIQMGKVGFIDNYNLCHIKTIQWDDIINADVELPQVVYEYHFITPERECPPCHEACNQSCWGDGENKCQQLNKVICHSDCEGRRCYDSMQCCHELCAAGCTGPLITDCLACQYYSDEGICKTECSTNNSYNEISKMELDVSSRFAYNTLCVEKCPEYFINDDGICVMECPDSKVLINGECVPCGHSCPVSCKGVDIVTSTNIETFRNCSIIKGHVTILQSSFTGYTEHYLNGTDIKMINHPPMNPDQLHVFESVKEITGFLNIQANHLEFTNLSTFSNLEIIGGRAITEDNAALFIAETSLESLGLTSLKSVQGGSIMILENSKLCYSDTITWTNISQTSRIIIAENKDKTKCASEGKVCHSECSSNSCWGPNADQCVSCKHNMWKNMCVHNCSHIPRVFDDGNGRCQSCNEECSDIPCNKSLSCSTPESICPSGHYLNSSLQDDKYMDDKLCLPCHPLCLQCSNPSTKCEKCRFYQYEDNCVSACSINTYPNEELKQCTPCSPFCRLGCFGPEAKHCRACKDFRLYEIGNKFSCVSECPSHKPNEISDKDIPDKVCSELTSSSEKMKGFLSILKNTKLCHSQCKKGCNGQGNNHCYECKTSRDGSICLIKCPTLKYKDNKGVCQPCHKDCVSGCSGSNNVLGKGGCNSCHMAFEKGNPKSPIFQCLPADGSCPDGFYISNISKTIKGKLQPIAGKVLCKKCDPLCKKCSKPGPICDECEHFSLKKKCVTKCPSMHFVDAKYKTCLPCSSECKKGCFGSTPSDCMACKTVRIYLTENKFICSSVCPREKPKKFRDQKIQETICVPYGIKTT